MTPLTMAAAAKWNTRHSDPAEDERIARDAIAESDWWARSGLVEHWPLTTDEAATLLRDAGQFEIDAAGLGELVARRIVPKPSLNDAGDEMEWNATDLVMAGRMLNDRRQWQHPSEHDANRNVCDLEVQKARLAGELPVILNAPPPVPRYDLASLYVLLMLCDSREGRERIGALLKVVLEVEHGVFLL